MAIREYCQNCGYPFLLYTNEDIDEEDKLCCLCWYPALIHYQASDEVFRALEDEVKELMEGMEGDFEHITKMKEELEKECSIACEFGGCNSCAWEESCIGMVR